LGELRFGSWEGRQICELDEEEEWRRYNTFRSAVRPPGGELMIEAQVRVIRQLESVVLKHKDECAVLVSHAEPIRLALAHYMGISIDLISRLEISPASLSVVEVGDWAPRILCINQTGNDLL
jgi:broad specificity phosphatase PhoE